MATTEQIDFYNKEGYLKYGPVLDRVIEIELGGGGQSSSEFQYGHRGRSAEEFNAPITQFIQVRMTSSASTRTFTSGPCGTRT